MPKRKYMFMRYEHGGQIRMNDVKPRTMKNDHDGVRCRLMHDFNIRSGGVILKIIE